MFCRNCGKEIDDKAYVCIHCGCLTSTKKPSKLSNQKTLILTNKAKTNIIIGAIVLVVFFAALFGCLYGIPLTVKYSAWQSMEIKQGFEGSFSYKTVFVGKDSTEKVTRGNTISPPHQYSKYPEIRFKGWFKDSACTIPWLSSDKVTSNITLYAKWEKIE